MAAVLNMINNFAPVPQGPRRKPAARAKRAAKLKQAAVVVGVNPPKVSHIKSWIQVPREYRLDPVTEYRYGVLNLRPDFDKITPRGDFGIRLLQHQMLTVRAMMDLEQKRTIKFWKMDTEGYFSQGTMETCAGVLREKPGAGKTFETLALIALNPDVRKIKEIGSFPLSRTWAREDAYLHKRELFRFSRGQTEVRTHYHRYYNVSLIFVALSVIDQWCDAIEDYTNLRTFVISDIRALHEFYNMTLHPELSDDDIDNYDIVLVKNGIISGRFDKPELKGTYLENIRTKPIITTFSELYKNCVWKRVILDDFDTLGVPSTAKVIPALFTWFVSATKKQVTKQSKHQEEWYDLEKILDEYRPTYLDVRYNAELFTFASIANDPAYTDESCGASKVNYHVLRFINPNEQVVGALNAMATDDSVTLAEMLNADAVKTASKGAGIKTDNPVEIFRKVLDDKWEAYQQSTKVIKYAEEVVQRVLSLPLPDEENKAKKITQKGLEDVRKNVEAPGPKATFIKLVKLNEEPVVTTIKEVKSTATKTQEENGKAIERVKNNLREGTCPVMAIPLSEASGTVILNCCGLVLCVEAVSMGTFLKAVKGTLTGVCPKCRASVTNKNVILIDRELSIDKLVEHSGVEAEKEEAEPAEIPENEKTLAQKALEIAEAQEKEPEKRGRKKKAAAPPVGDLTTRNKYNFLVYMLQHTTTETLEYYADHIHKDINVRIRGLMQGKLDKGEAPIEDKKSLIFANYDEQIEIIQNKLESAGITFSKLCGRRDEIHHMVKRFNLPNDHPDSIRVLVVKGAEFCAGLNLQAATELIYMHFVVDPAIETQIAGRGARIGRTHNLNIWYPLYHNEVEQLRIRQEKYAGLPDAELEAPAEGAAANGNEPNGEISPAEGSPDEDERAE